MLVDEAAGASVRLARRAQAGRARWTPSAYDPAGMRVLDAGASTGGFTDVLLRRGAAHVVAVDVGYGQLAWALQTDPRVTVLDRTNVRGLEPAQVGEPVDLVVADLSFIPLGLVLPALVALRAPGGDLLPMVKPQFEVGRERLPSGGVVRDPALRAPAVRRRRRAGCRARARACAAWSPARCRGRAATSSTSCGCAPARRRWTRRTCARGREGPQ